MDGPFYIITRIITTVQMKIKK